MPTRGKFGKKAAVRDPRTLLIRTFLKPEVVQAPPPSRQWDRGVKAWGMMMNGPQAVMPPGVDRNGIGDCTCAACAHGIQETTANTGIMVTVPDPIILQLYETCGGYVPGNPATDGGCIVLTVLKEWQQHGIAGRKAAAYAACSLTDHRDVEACINLFGFVYIGFAVPNSCMAQFDNGQPWDVVSPDGGIEGGHAVIGVDYDQDGITVITWGQLQRMTWAFWDKYVDEAYGIVLPEWIAQNGMSPSGLDLNGLLTAVTQLTQDPAPAPVVNPKPDPTVQAWLAWSAKVADYIAAVYAGGDTRSALIWQTQLSQYTPGILALLQAQPHALPADVPKLPEG